MTFKKNDSKTLEAVGKHIGQLRKQGDSNKIKGLVLTIDLDRNRTGAGLLTTANENGFPKNNIVRYALNSVGAMGQLANLRKIGNKAFVAMMHEDEKSEKPYHDTAMELGTTVLESIHGKDAEMVDIVCAADVEAKKMNVFAGTDQDNWRAVMVKKAIANAITVDTPNKMAIIGVNHKIGATLHISGLLLSDLWSEQDRELRFEFEGKSLVGLTRVDSQGIFQAVLKDMRTENYYVQPMNRNGARPNNNKRIAAFGKMICTGKYVLIDVPTGHDDHLAAMDMSERQRIIEVGPRKFAMNGALANA